MTIAPPSDRPRTQQRSPFPLLIVFFLRSDQLVWVGAIAAAVAVIAVTHDYGRSVGIAAGVVVVAVTTIVAVLVDRRRVPGKRMLVRGRQVSPRRVVALAVTLALLGGALVLTISLARKTYEGAVATLRRLP